MATVAIESVAVIWILTIGLVGMGLLVCVLAAYVLQRNQRAPDQALTLMVQDLVNVALTAKRPERTRWAWDGKPPLAGPDGEVPLTLAEAPDEQPDTAVLAGEM